MEKRKRGGRGRSDRKSSSNDRVALTACLDRDIRDGDEEKNYRSRKIVVIGLIS